MAARLRRLHDTFMSFANGLQLSTKK